MTKIFIIVNGSNDLYYPINKCITELSNNICNIEKFEIYTFYKIIKSDPNSLWKGSYSEEVSSLGLGGFIYKDHSINKISVDKYFRKIIVSDKEMKIMAPDLFLNDFLSENDDNIVILGGHGGPFQSLLDLDINPPMSLNTVKLCKRIKKFKIDLLFLDMCAMNYIEVIYELLLNSRISNIITYKNIAPFDGVSYYKIIKEFEKLDQEKQWFKFYKIINDSPFIYVNNNDLEKFENLKNIQSTLVKDTIPDIEYNMELDIEKFRVEMKSIAMENSKAKRTRGLKLNYIKYYLVDDIERKLYSELSYAKDNLWRLIVTRSMVNFENVESPEYLKLDKSSLENIIYLHNSTLKQNEIDKKVNEFIQFKHK